MTKLTMRGLIERYRRGDAIVCPTCARDYQWNGRHTLSLIRLVVNHGGECCRQVFYAGKAAK